MEGLFDISLDASTAKSFSYKVKIDVDNHIFEGHFPEKSVLPGVCSLYMVKLCVQDFFKRENLTSTYIKDMKFLSLILVENLCILSINIDYKLENDDIIISAKIFHNDKIALKLQATLN